MNDREKVISEFERCIGSFSPADTSDEYFMCVCKRALELLKEQEITVQPERQYLNIDPHRDKYRCSRCGELGLRYLQRFCGGCGKEVDWLDRI